MAAYKKEETSQPTFKDRICVKSSEDSAPCWITAMVFYPPDRLYLTDYNNRALKFANTHNKDLSYRRKVDGKPWDVTGVFHDTIALTLPNERRIQFVDISERKMRLKRTLRLGKQYWGISNCKENLIVSSLLPPELHVIDRKGHVLTIISKSDIGDDIFSRPIFIQRSRTSILVSDKEKEEVILFDYDDKVQKTYRTNGSPRGISAGGSIFVCGQKNVLSISRNDSKRIISLPGLNDPYTLSYCFDARELYVTSFSGNGDQDDYLYVYTL